MKKSLKGALLSGLVFPGAGQLWLKCYLRGAVLILVVAAALSAIVMKTTEQAMTLLEKMEASGTVDMVALLKSAATLSNAPTTKSASELLVLCWIVGMVDAYFVGRKRDLAKPENTPKQT